ncbi:cytochrome P450 [Saccharopolyspora endophytica]|uniref:Cytochrome P450 n=1 Tax=Saccharopolyspora endophytica TaxID=543886 RepID=A0ABS5DNM4_9PSEU|nr:cytochrome P450 [Saccharopolyspora endophytica]MBQ0927901.1 cytochrome P450 [Saccharopolyspora endophytica]
MVFQLEKVNEAIRRRVPPLTSMPLPRSVDQRIFEKQWPVTELAPPPPGSGLKPVLGDAGAPLIGHSLDFMRYGPAFALRRFELYGPVSWAYSLGQRMVTLGGPEATSAALVNKDKAFSQGGWRKLIDRFFHRGLMLMDFEEHLGHRRIMQQAFTRQRLTGYVDQMGPTLREGVTSWGGQDKTRLYWLLKQLTLDVATRVFMDRRSGQEADRVNRAFVDSVRAATAVVRYPVPGGRWAAGLAGRKLLERYFADNIGTARAVEGDDLFSALCHARSEDGEQFGDDDVINHMIFLMMAAHDTSTITSSAAAYYLAKHPEWQERARAESLAMGEEIPDIEALEKLDTLDLVIKEALRLVAPVPSMVRETVRDTEVLGHHVPAGTMVGVSPLVNHFSPDHWTNPFDFDPERFAEHRREDKSHRFAWMPFGGGAHKCIGLHFGTLEVKLLLHEMLRAYTWSVPDDYEVKWDYVSLPVPVDGLPVRLRRR